MTLRGFGGAVDKPHAYRIIYCYMLSDHQLEIVINIVAVAFKIKMGERCVIFHCSANTVVHINKEAVFGVIHEELMQISVGIDKRIVVFCFVTFFEYVATVFQVRLVYSRIPQLSASVNIPAHDRL